MKRSVALLAFCLSLTTGAASAQTVSTASPDRRNTIEVTLSDSGALTYRISRNGKAIIDTSALGLVLQNRPPFGTTLGDGGLKLAAQATTTGIDDFTLPVGKTKHVRAAYGQSTLTFDTGKADLPRLQLMVRAYDDGVAFRYVIPAQDGVGALDIQDEATAYRFAGDYDCHGLNQGRYENSFEGEHDAIRASQFRPFHLFQAPVVCRTGEAAFAIAESDPQIYPGAYYTGLNDGAPGVRLTLTPRKDNDPGARFNTRAAHIDAAQGFRTPWRVVMLGDSAGQLIESELINALAAPSKIADTGWIKPGLSAWDWWNGNQFPLPAPHNANGQVSGMNTATYKAYADFAAEMGFAYILIDEGWSVGSTVEPNPAADVTRPKPEMDIAEIVRYAKARGVGVWIWLQWQQLDRQLDEALAIYEKWGVKGVKVDFLNRNDQEIMPFYHRLLSKAADHRLMVDLHGAFPPAGLTRTYPNYMTQEGVLGAENNKWSRRITAKHNVTLAFTRGLLGPMDYTPGGFRHARPDDFPAEQRFINPYVMTTRGAGLAMYVVYESPFQMVSDSPPAYKKADGSLEDGVDFLKVVPASWDETRFIAGDIDDHVVIARRSGDRWFIGGMTDKAKSVKVPLGFLGDGAYTATLWQDGESVSTLKRRQIRTAKGESLTLDMAANGGGVIVLMPEAKTKNRK
ncbi:glycoside hydrolase family 97 protein [Asticcacaulis sp. AND118]|uniref:glycoside hydrolase family 97 protein n=1 Tax=Asticcacaulis sp. AND118 TaxID=2840468 RepID=UPI001CFFAB57|nr:glycoside hydrolase family 97 protein [Asticcacaulis sp. AND118]UDF04190.1 glycoside hydrolase family 97 protein [Asticcacaulis sp. AND118]